MGRAKRFAEHALYHWDDYDPVIDLDAALACVRAATGEESAPEITDDDVPGSPGYWCHDSYNGNCQYQP